MAHYSNNKLNGIDVATSATVFACAAAVRMAQTRQGSVLVRRPVC